LQATGQIEKALSNVKYKPKNLRTTNRFKQSVEKYLSHYYNYGSHVIAANNKSRERIRNRNRFGKS